MVPPRRSSLWRARTAALYRSTRSWVWTGWRSPERSVRCSPDDSVVFTWAVCEPPFLPALNEPVDLAPVTKETSDPNWASNATLEVQADFYVANRGDNTIVHMWQDGARGNSAPDSAAWRTALGALQLNGIGGSPESGKIWVTLSGPVPDMGYAKGAVIELPAFLAPSGRPRSARSLLSHPAAVHVDRLAGQVAGFV